jgi:hypothetical protein
MPIAAKRTGGGMNKPNFFEMFTADEKAARVRKLAASMSDEAVADLTGLSLEMIRRILAEPKANEAA